jgi:hypothetical protein
LRTKETSHRSPGLFLPLGEGFEAVTAIFNEREFMSNKPIIADELRQAIIDEVNQYFNCNLATHNALIDTIMQLITARDQKHYKQMVSIASSVRIRSKAGNHLDMENYEMVAAVPLTTLKKIMEIK